jgi:predicted RecB family nuclease
VQISEIVYPNEGPTKRNRFYPQPDPPSAQFNKDLTKLVKALTKDGRVKHSRSLTWSRAFLSKSRYMCGRQSPKKLWQMVYDPEPAQEPLPGTVKGMGIEVGINARLLWPGGVLVDTKYDDYAEATRRTKALIADPTVPAVFEATMVYDGVLIRVDALERLPDGRWRLNEVKSSTRIKDEHLEDLALQTYVIAGNDLELADAYLVYINDRYVRGENIDWNALFCREDVSDSVIHLLPEVPERIANMHEVLCSTEAPDIRASRHCFQPHDCEFWQRCISDKPKDWVFYIPRISSHSFDELEGSGVISMRDVPDDFPLIPKQQRVVGVAKSGKVYRSLELPKILPLLAPPAGYLDFETFSPAMPIYVNTRPYQRIPFQWSLHFNDGSGSLIHADFLARGEPDPRREFSETLLKVSEQFPGAIMAWSRFEEKVIRDMSELFPDLAERLTTLLYRIVDLLQIVRDHVAHPDFHGSYSMKAVAPAVAPEVTYSDLDIADGGGASAAFYRIVADPTLCPEARDGLRQSLLEYCQRDTLALARVHDWLIQGN